MGDRFACDALDQVTGVVYDIVRPDVNLGPGSGHEQTEYDAMGNRDTFMTDANTNVYTANGLNQYTAIDGAALTYDLDGNLVFDNQGRTLSWDGENRLRSVAPISPTNGSVKVEMSYDDQSRRVGKTVSVRTNGVWVQQSDTVFTYQGWNLISEVRSQGSGVSTNVYIWGRDLSGSLQGAGGVGGLLCSYSTLSPSLHYFSYDGNGNVILLTDAAGAVAGRYRYEVFGALRSMTGLAAVENPYRFSTKYSDDETGLVYFGYRYYNPIIGGFINRDTIEEWGGLNLMSYIINNPVNYIDILGLCFPGDKQFVYENCQLKNRRSTGEKATEYNYHWIAGIVMNKAVVEAKCECEVKANRYCDKVDQECKCTKSSMPSECCVVGEYDWVETGRVNDVLKDKDVIEFVDSISDKHSFDFDGSLADLKKFWGYVAWWGEFEKNCAKACEAIK